MTGKGHLATGFIAGTAFIYTGPDILELGIFTIATAIGSRLPDKMENFMGFRILTHRGISHWAMAWLILAAAAFVDFYQLQLAPPLLSLAIAGVSFGSLVHLMGDLPNPMGVPLIHPTKRISLNWWKSGEMEGLIIAAFVGGHLAIGWSLGFWTP